MKKLLFLGTCKGTIEMVKTARRRGIYTIVTDFSSPEKSLGKMFSDEYWMISTSNLNELEQKCREEHINGVVTGVSEFNLEMNMELCRRLHLPCYCTPEAWHFSRNKYDFKQLCKRNHVRMAEDYSMSNPPTEAEIARVQFPVVVKAVDLSSNRGMSYCFTQEDLIKACEYARSLSKSETIICERMLKGPEVSAVYVMAAGEVRLLSFCSMYHQPGEPKNCYCISTSETKYLRRFLEEENEEIKRALRAVGCKEGFAWVEMIIDERDDHFYLLEMGYRLCGDEINIPLRTVADFDVHEWIINYALGKKNTLEELPADQEDYYSTCACVYSLWTNQTATIGAMEGVEDILENQEIYWDSLVRQGDTIGGHLLLGEFMFEAKDVYEMCDIIRMINERVSIRNTSGEEMIIHYTDYEHLVRTSRSYAE